MFINRILFIAGAGLIWLSSCTQPAEAPQPAAPRPTKFSEIKAADNFRWMSEKQVTINLTGFPTIEPVTSILTIMTEDDRVLMNQSYTLDENGSFRVLVPASESKLKLKFGSIEKEVNVAETVNTDLLPVITDVE